MFIGRLRELSILEKHYKAGAWQCIVLWGRRRVGKTTLINEFIKDKPAIYFAATESTLEENLESFNACLNSWYGRSVSLAHRGFQEALEELAATAAEEQLVLVIDEYPYLAKAYPAISSVLQNLIDQRLQHTKLYLILCGSAMSFMENQVLGYQSPLYGRRTGQLKVEPLNFYDSCCFFQNFTLRELAVIYGITGGIPMYLAQMRDSLSLEENITNSFLTVDGYLFEEPGNLLKQELREPAIYNSIIRAIANGASKSSEICNKVQLESSACSNYVDKLIELGIVVKERPYGQDSGRKTIYSLSDSMFRFWYRFVPDNLMLIQRGFSQQAWNNISKHLSEFMGPVFEKICADYLWEHYYESPVAFQATGRWWGNNPSLKREEEIDIVAGNQQGQAIVCECKWRNELLDVEVIDKLMERAKLLSFSEHYYYFFSKSGFTEKARERALVDKRIRLISLEEML